ncbi:MAG: xanthine dehydrogenase family protein molybdopterin-binding subunit [Rhodospirillaceae bacterium]|nr:xanthine dehydrogenase family protein molybdopterin-binding subunit [Rhodospirillaceae bacterium]
MKFGLGQSIPRWEDPRLLRGGGRYTDDLNRPDQAYGHVLRSSCAHATIDRIDMTAALEAPGVLAILVHDDWAADALGVLPSLAPMLLPLKRPDDTPIHEPYRPPLAPGVVKFVGDPVAFVVAETAAQARDAAELIDIDYEELPAVIRTEEAVTDDAALVWPDLGDNVSFRQSMGDWEAVDGIFQTAAHVVSMDLPINRVAQNPMEPRAALGEYDRYADRYTLWTGTQGPHDNRNLLAQFTLKIPISKLRLVSPDMGGGFGLRGGLFPEMPLVVWAARKVGRPVKWKGDRSEHFLVDDQGRDSRLTAELALSEEGDFLATRVKSVAALGAYCSFFGPLPTFGNMGAIVGMYKTGAAAVDVTAVFTNTCPIGPYRGAGRPESIYLCEMLVERAAAEMGFDRVALRRRNLIPEDAMPFQTGLQYRYDCGQFETNMDKALAAADYAGFERRRQESAARSKLRGFGITNAIEQSAGLGDEGAEIRFDPEGGVTLTVGTLSHGQGHETVFRQALCNTLGLEFEQIRFVQGDTDIVAYGHGTYGSRSSGLGSGVIQAASNKIIEKGKIIAAHHFETATTDVEFNDGTFSVAGTDKIIAITEIARLAHNFFGAPGGGENGLCASATFRHPGPTFPNGTHCCELEIDPETGMAELLNWVAINDVGTVMNPLLLKGQLHGGIVQGAGQILMEDIVWDENGQLITGSFMDYAVPRAEDMPSITVCSSPTITKTNPLGIKGAGEAGCVGGMACTMIALLDAVRPAGVTELPMPATPMAVWQALQMAQDS